MDQTYRISRRSADGLPEYLIVTLPKHPNQYQVGEKLTIQIEDRKVPCHVVKSMNKDNFILYVA